MAALCFFKAQKNDLWFYAFWTAVGFAFMTKGPIIVVIFVVLFILSTLMGNFFFLRNRHFWWGTIIALFLILPWHLEAYRHNPELFIEDYIKKHWFSRSFSAIEGHASNYYFYIRTLINKYHPWVAFLPFSLAYVLYKAIREKNKKGYLLILVWSLFVLGFFTVLIQTKLAWYILPCYPALSLSVGILLSMRWKETHAILAKLLIGFVLIMHIPFSSVIVQDYSPGVKDIAPFVRQHVPIEEDMHFYEFHEQPAATFYMDRNILYIDSLEELDFWMKKKRPFWLTVPRPLYQALLEKFKKRGFRILTESRVSKDNLVLLQSN